MKANLIKVDKTKEAIIKNLNSFEVDILIRELIEYKEGNIQVGALNIIKRAIERI